MVKIKKNKKVIRGPKRQTNFYMSKIDNKKRKNKK